MKKISKRLQKIDSLITAQYQSIWDCCCDHGLLGLTLLKRKAAEKIHFVDIVPALTSKVELLLKTHFNSADFTDRWQVHCIDVAELPLKAQDKQLVIIAGVGGGLVAEFIDKIIGCFQQNLPEGSNRELEFILCAVHHNADVRRCLIKHNVTLLEECIVSENKRFYEVIHVRTQFSSNPSIENKSRNVSPVGDKMWDLSNEEHQIYLTKTLSHYQRTLLTAKETERSKIEAIIKLYSSL
jgi:tRNA (adenine22-N1)-methyltransferase